MQRRPVLPLGVKFDPTDVQLISGYLGPKVRGGRLAWNAIGFSDLVYKKPPWEFCTDLTAFPGDEKHYFFTELKMMNQNRVVRTIGSYGTWHESSSKKILGGNNYINNNNGIIGFNKLLNFKLKGEGKEMKTTDWLMHEFSLPEKETNLVLCVIQKKKKRKEEMGSAYDTYPEVDPMSFLDPDSTSSAGGDPCPAPAPAPAPAHDDHFELQALDLEEEEEETRPSKKMRSDPKFDDQPFSVASSSADLIPDFWTDLATGFPDDVFGLPDDVFLFTNTSF
ncbi:hypothetical protein SO802_032240 [Lithocarpus litseifolius]|uniref:NAC domain-containing protein n=1 Tax=Lithocarpus litseifolius TaxID=425828 RepID=A0AAW2BR66_9ROSI